MCDTEMHEPRLFCVLQCDPGNSIAPAGPLCYRLPSKLLFIKKFFHRHFVSATPTQEATLLRKRMDAEAQVPQNSARVCACVCISLTHIHINTTKSNRNTREDRDSGLHWENKKPNLEKGLPN